MTKSSPYKHILDIVADVRLMPYPEKKAIFAAISFVNPNDCLEACDTVTVDILKKWQQQMNDLGEGCNEKEKK